MKSALIDRPWLVGRPAPAGLAVEDDDDVGAVPGVQRVQRIDEALPLLARGMPGQAAIETL